MPVKSFKKNKKSIVAGSPAIEEHEQIMDAMRNEQDSLSSIAGADSTEKATVPEGSPSVHTASSGFPAGNTVGVFSTFNTEPLKNVQTRVPLSVYEKLNRMKYFAGQRTSIGDIVAQAISEYCERHPV